MMLARDVSMELSDVADVEVGGCHIFGLRPEGALVSVLAFTRLHVTSSVLVARLPATFDGPRKFFEGLDTLAAPWDATDEDELRQAVLKAATELSKLTAAARRKLVKELRIRISQADSGTPRGEISAYERLAGQLENDPRVAPIAEALDVVARAVSVAHAGIALEIGAGQTGDQIEATSRVSVVLSDNLIPGIITFYGRGEQNLAVEEQSLKQLEGLVRDSAPIFGAAGDVHIRDNRLGRLALSIGMIKVLDSLIQNPRPLTAAYDSFHLTDNVLDAVVTEIVARHTTMTSNDFTLESLPIGEPPPNGVVTNVIGDTATYTGNHARIPVAGAAPAIVRDITRTSAEAANLELQIL
jgi:hypothetical protein